MPKFRPLSKHLLNVVLKLESAQKQQKGLLSWVRGEQLQGLAAVFVRKGRAEKEGESRD